MHYGDYTQKETLQTVKQTPPVEGFIPPAVGKGRRLPTERSRLTQHTLAPPAGATEASKDMIRASFNNG